MLLGGIPGLSQAGEGLELGREADPGPTPTLCLGSVTLRREGGSMGETRRKEEVKSLTVWDLKIDIFRQGNIYQV